MAYRYGNNRYQRQLMPRAIDEYIESDDPVRAYDAFIEALDLGRLGITFDPNKTGNPEYHPKVMLKLIVYSYSYGIHSSRKLERALYHLIEGNTLFLDGSKIRANASVSNTWDKKKVEKVLKRIDKRITELLTEYDRRDIAEEDMASLVTTKGRTYYRYHTNTQL